MIITFNIKFEKPLPKSEDILKELRNNTGLEDIDYGSSGSRTFIVTHPLFLKPVFSLIFESELDQITLWLKQNSINYLMEATLATLIKLGGIYEFNFNELAKKKWIEVKDVYQNRKLFPDGDFDSIIKEWSS
jgi:hypothetical protein